MVLLGFRTVFGFYKRAPRCNEMRAAYDCTSICAGLCHALAYDSTWPIVFLDAEKREGMVRLRVVLRYGRLPYSQVRSVSTTDRSTHLS